MCRTAVESGAASCPSCRADLTLLSGLANDATAALARAEQLRQDGQLAPAVQAYLDVLELDPTNAAARAALGPVLRALRAPREVRSIVVPLVSGALIAAAAFAGGWWLARQG